MTTRKYITSKELATLLGVTLSCIERWRSTGTGPKIPYIIVGNRMVRYLLEDVEAHLASLRRVA
jgi:predicted DNA-binding transcriptional regulator AlpA